MTNLLYTNDNIVIMHGMTSESVDLIYLDPPFNSKRMYAAPIGSKAAGASFKDMWTWEDVDEQSLELLFNRYPGLVSYIRSIDETHSAAMKAYIAYMAQRLIEMHRILKPTGSIYLHCDPTAGHYLRGVMDAIFGRGGFRNEIVWCYSGPARSEKHFVRKHDTILFYAKSDDALFNADSVRVRHKRQKPSSGRGMAAGNRTLEEIRADEITQIKKGKAGPDWWDDIGSGSHMPKSERTGYPTQKPLKLLKRIIQASSKEKDIVFDPFCGCATACVAAQQLNRHWIGIDIEEKAVDVLIERLSDDAGMFSDFTHLKEAVGRQDIEVMRPTDAKQKLFANQQGKCNGCFELTDYKLLEVDHIVPKSRGGGDFFENYQLLCANCNRIKGNRPMQYLLTKLNKINNLKRGSLSF